MRLQLSQDDSLREIASVVAGLPTESLSTDRRSPCSSGKPRLLSTKVCHSWRPAVSEGLSFVETCGQRSGSVGRPATTDSFPFASELHGALADGVADRLVGRDGGEPCRLGLALVSQEVNQTPVARHSCRRRRTGILLQNLSRLRQPISLLSRASREIQTSRFPL